MGQIWDILRFLYITETLRVYCDVVRTTLCGRICKSNGVRKMLWEIRKKAYVHVYRNKLGQLCEKEVVRKTLWEWCCENDIVNITLLGWWWKKNFMRRCDKDVVRKTLWERRCDKDVVWKMLWENPCEKDVVRNTLRKTLWERLYLMVLKPRYRLCPCFISRY